MCNKLHWIQQRIYRCNRRAFTLSRRCRVSRSRPRVSRETITAISLWRHNSGHWDNEESIAAHSNAIPRTMGCITIYGSRGIWIPYKENKVIRIPYKENQVIRICRPRRLYQGRFRAKYWINGSMDAYVLVTRRGICHWINMCHQYTCLLLTDILGAAQRQKYFESNIYNYFAHLGSPVTERVLVCVSDCE